MNINSSTAPHLNSFEFNIAQWPTAPVEPLDQLQQLPAISESSVNQPHEHEVSSTSASDISRFRKLVGKFTYKIESASDNQSFSSPMKEMKQNASTVPVSKRPSRGSPEVEATEAEGSSLRRSWVNSPSKAWQQPFNISDFPEEEFKKAFRMSKTTFDMICDELRPFLTENTENPMAIPVGQRIAVCIWSLATGEPLPTVLKPFGLENSTCHKLVIEVCHAMWTVLVPKVVQWPDEHKMMDIKRDFEMNSGIPNVVGSVYTTHVPIIASKVIAGLFFNRRHTERNQETSYSITVQGVVDPKGVFTDICVGWPGSMTDDKVLEQSALYQRANRGLLKDLWVVGNAGFPLMDWVLVPYTTQNVTWTQHALNEKVGKVQHALNEKVGKVQTIAKEAFMRLKARWRCLQMRIEGEPRDLAYILGACFVLHNICEMRDEGMSPELRFELFDDEVVPENPVRSMNALQARDQIAHKLTHLSFAGKPFL